MPEIVLSEEQTRIVALANEPIPVRDQSGRVVGELSPVRFTPEEMAEADRARAADARRFSTSEVLSHLLVLAEAEKRKGTRLEKSEVRQILDDLIGRKGA